ncbi:MAG: tRNA guanosine(34) transglycosylase Tgt [Candidatus Eremiobacteraeota bacterium]|nr:tRNA guanosine(34) transglycosylase Tgt [Candidatus Eremiobacteraeota bacterium]MBC5802669.1 tRNA guanosine(34) transglycosylase Tgt [Candidatus Eremiobacteraeota bacterium]MBC5822030.1 tRNA guanosine(34) transglycosylase Tgt [Candidatus Eremiobacteraeota bacterium]
MHARDGAARRGSLMLAHGAVETPAFMPVGTAATVKALTPDDLRAFDTRIVLANVYHLWLRPGRETIEALGGLHAFMGWERNVLTDSGGFQVFSLESRREVCDDGVRFRSHLDGSEHEFTPENVMAFQEALGVDVAMALDVCVKLPADREAIARSVRLTSAWARRCAQARERAQTQLFGIVQGGLDERAREQSAHELVALALPGYAIGGLSVGEGREALHRTARFTATLLPPDKPRYLMGVGTVPDLLRAVDAGIDLFDCVYPTRCGRNGRALTFDGDLNIRNAILARDARPLDATCGCAVCATYTRAYLSHLFRAEEMLGPRLLSYHNLALFAKLMAHVREAIENRRWDAYRDTMLQRSFAPPSTENSSR